ncbi:MAG TPA: metal ABC transporter permease [bacterium]|nr:metal ABC transporter permease [bacterium]
MLEFLDYDFMQRALAAGLLIGLVAPILGMFLTVRRQALIADTLAHASLAGVALGFLLGLDPLITAGVVAIIAALFIERLRTLGWFTGDSLLALVLSGSLAFAVVGMSAAHKFNAGVLQYLFGGITTVSGQDLLLISIVSVTVFLFSTLLFKEFFLLSFDEDIAKAQGISVGILNTLMALMTAMTVAVGMRVVGVLLMGALMVIPVLTAMRFNAGFKVSTMIAVAVSLLSVVTGLLLSYVYDIAAGGAIVLVAISFFIFSSLLSLSRK